MAAYNPDGFPSRRQRLLLNRTVLMVDKDKWISPFDLFMGQLTERYGDPVIRSDAAQLTVTLDLDGKKAVRQLIVPTFFTFSELHQVIQSVYRWQDCHLHEFVIEQYEDGQPRTTLISFDDDEGDELQNRRQDVDVSLSEVFGDPALSKADGVTYLYDFGDGWEHSIRCERIVENYNKSHAQCIYMEGDAPPEDVGGPYGFQNMLEILGDETHPEYAEMRAWADGMHWKPLAQGDREKVNRYLERRMYDFNWY